MVLAVVMGTACAGRLVGVADPPTLVAINPTTAKATPVGSPIPYELQAQELSTYDDAHGVLYLLGYNDSDTHTNLVGVNSKTGVVVSDIELPFVTESFVGVGQTVAFDPVSGHVLASGRLTPTSNHSILLVDPVKGTYAKLAEIGFGDVLGTTSVYDHLTSTLFLQFASNNAVDLYGVNLKTGVATVIPQDSSTGQTLETMDFSPSTGLVFGVGFKAVGSAFTRNIVQLDPKTSKITVIAELPQYLVIAGSIAALNDSPATRSLFVYLQKASAAPSDPFDLVQVSTSKGTVVTSPVAGTNDVLPWSLEYFST